MQKAWLNIASLHSSLLRYDPNIQIFVIHPLPSTSFSKFNARKRKEKKINEGMENWITGKRERENDHRCSFPFKTELSMKRDRERERKRNGNYTSAPAASIIACLIRLDDFSARKSRALFYTTVGRILKLHCIE